MHLSDEEIFLQCIEQDFAIMDYCDVKSYKAKKTPWIGSQQEICYKNTFRGMKKEQMGEATETTFCATGSSLPCLTKEYYEYCNPKAAMLGIYAFQLREWIDYFPPSLVKIFSSESFFEEPEFVLRDIETFLGIDKVEMDWTDISNQVYNMALAGAVDPDDIVSSFKTNNFIVAHSDTGEYPELSHSTRKKLSKQFKHYNKILEKMVDKTFDWGV